MGTLVIVQVTVASKRGFQVGRGKVVSTAALERLLSFVSQRDVASDRLHHPASHRGPLPDVESAELKDKMTVLLGGRAAESIVFEETSTGAADDLAKATDIARSMVTRYGMDETLGMVSLESERSAFLEIPGEYVATRRDFSEQTAREVDCAVRDLVTQDFERAVAILEAHRDALVASAGSRRRRYAAMNCRC
jgi:hypothetical protein